MTQGNESFAKNFIRGFIRKRENPRRSDEHGLEYNYDNRVGFSVDRTAKPHKDALKGLPGNVLGRLSKLADSTVFYGVNISHSAPASKFFGPSAGGTLGQFFDSHVPQGGAYTAVRVPKPGIYTRGGQATFVGEAGLYLELHEMTHEAYPVGRDLDRSLSRALGLTRGANESWSDAVSRFFNSKCTKKGP